MHLETISKVETAYQTFVERIRDGVWKVGDCLPTETELATEFDCGRNTISKAVTRLVHEGLVERKKRAGTRVLRAVSERSGHATVELDAVAFICPSDEHEGIWRTMKGFQQASREKGRRMLMLTTGSDYRKELEIIGRLSEFDVQGVAINGLGPCPEDLPQFTKKLTESGLPMIQAGVGFFGMQTPSVIVDGFDAIHTMVRYLAGKGARRIGFFDMCTTAPACLSARYQGYRWTMAELGLEEDERLVYMPQSVSVNFDDPIAEPRAFGRDYLERVKDLGLEAVVCGMDSWALGLIEAAAERGIQVPRDLLVTGVDDYAIASTAPVPLTTYRVPFEEMGRKSFEMLEEMIATGRWKNLGTQVQMRGKLVVRKSA